MRLAATRTDQDAIHTSLVDELAGPLARMDQLRPSARAVKYNVLVARFALMGVRER